ncbi:clusterin [Genypterus blacodes]|uniref:clusterin n=1 Tax=Genypterus blacodes TaxID=154954 RepID=UPI003F762F91
MLMMMMMMRKKGSRSLAAMAFLLASVNCILPPSKEDLNKISLQGEQYLGKQIEGAIIGVKEMKNVMEQSSDEHNKFLDALEKTKKQKEEAMHAAHEMEAKLEQQEEVCNETMKALWEECKPCLKNTCVKYYSRTCSSGSGLVGRQLEEVLNRSSPFSIWINGENTNVLEKEGERQQEQFKNLEEKYTVMADGVDGIFTDSMKVGDHMNIPAIPWLVRGMPFLGGSNLDTLRVARSLFMDSDFHGFHRLFSPMMGMGHNWLKSMMGSDSDVDPSANPDENVNEDVVITKPFGNGKMTCREIRRNSAGCIKFRGECQKCKEIQHLDCSGQKPLEGPLKEELEEALALAERFTQEYNTLLQRFQQQMFNTSYILDLLNKQFGWVSSLANNTDNHDGIFRIQTVIYRDGDKKPGEDTKPAKTDVSVKLFDSPPMNFSMPGDFPWSDSRFSELVAQAALDRYKEGVIEVK